MLNFFNWHLPFIVPVGNWPVPVQPHILWSRACPNSVQSSLALQFTRPNSHGADVSHGTGWHNCNHQHRSERQPGPQQRYCSGVRAQARSNQWSCLRRGNPFSYILWQYFEMCYWLFSMQAVRHWMTVALSFCLLSDFTPSSLPLCRQPTEHSCCGKVKRRNVLQ